jgi:hypothetical protein
MSRIRHHGMPVELNWSKSSYSSSSNGEDCVEVAKSDGAVRVRDSKDVHRGQVAVSATAWGSFVMYVSAS